MTRRRHAFTFVEALIVVLLGSAVAIVVVGLMGYSTRSFERANQRLDPRQSASSVLMLLRQNLNDARRYRISADNTTLKFSTARTVGVLRFDPAGGTITITNLQGEEGRLETLARGVKAFTVHQLRPGTLRVSLEIARPEVEDGLATLGDLKVVDEIHCPAAARDPRIPFKRAFGRRSIEI